MKTLITHIRSAVFGLLRSRATLEAGIFLLRLKVVGPETVSRWRRNGLRAYLRGRSQSAVSRPKAKTAIRKLIHGGRLAYLFEWGKLLKLRDLEQIKYRWETKLRAGLQNAGLRKDEILSRCRAFFGDPKRRATLWRVFGFQFAIIVGIVILQKSATMMLNSDSKPVENAASDSNATSPTTTVSDEPREYTAALLAAPRDELRRQQFETVVAAVKGLRRTSLAEKMDSRPVGYWSRLQDDIAVACASMEIYLQLEKVLDNYEAAKRLIDENNCIGSISGKIGLRSGDWITIIKKNASAGGGIPLHCLRPRSGNSCYWTAADWK
jgi:hypothetical protein